MYGMVHEQIGVVVIDLKNPNINSLTELHFQKVYYLLPYSKRHINTHNFIGSMVCGSVFFRVANKI